MKRPYREGDWFAVPLGDGSFATGIVTHGTRKAIHGSFFGPPRAAIPSPDDLAALRPEDALWSGRFSDRAIVEQRWPVIGHRADFDRAQWPARGSAPAAGSGLVERRIAASAAGRTFEPPRVSVRDVGSLLEGALLAAGFERMWLRWTESLSAFDLARMEAFVNANPHAAIRLEGNAVAQIDALREWPALTVLDVDSRRFPATVVAFPHVTELRLDGVPVDLKRTIAAFPSLRTLRIRARGGKLNAASLSSATELAHLELRDAVVERTERFRELRLLRALDIGGASLDDPESVLRLPLQSLRLAHIASLASIAGLRDQPMMHTLALAGLLAIDDVRPVATMALLESLELRGLWQFAVNDLAFVRTMPALRRLLVDIGGRRKNAEIYRQGAYATPLPVTR